jgi:hypothetical protein
LPLKNNLAQGIAGLAYTIESAADNRTPVIHWSPDPVTTNVEFHLATARTDGRPDHERQHAIQWLRQLLSTGPRSTRNVYDEAAAHGISPRTLRRAFCEINGQAVREGPFLSGHWMWKLPGKDGQNQGAKFWPSSQFPDVFANRPQPWRTSETSTVTFYPIRPDP